MIGRRRSVLGELPVTQQIAERYPEVSGYQPGFGYAPYDRVSRLLRRNSWPRIPLEMLTDSQDSLELPNEDIETIINQFTMPFNEDHLPSEGCITVGSLIKGFIDVDKPPSCLPLFYFHFGYKEGPSGHEQGPRVRKGEKQPDIAAGIFVLGALASITGSFKGVHYEFTALPVAAGKYLGNDSDMFRHDLKLHYVDLAASRFTVTQRNDLRRKFNDLPRTRTGVSQGLSERQLAAMIEIDENRLYLAY